MAEISKCTDYDYSASALNAQVQDVLRALIAAFESHDSKGILLVDPSLFLEHRQEDLFPKYLEAFQERVFAADIHHPKFDSRFSPWLISLDLKQPEDYALLKASVKQAFEEIDPEQLMENRGRMICGWIFSSFTASSLADHIAKTAVQTLAAESSFVIRFYDPAVNSIVWSVLDSWQQSRLLGPIEEWFLLNGDGELVSRCNEKKSEMQYTFSLALADSTQEQLKLSGVMNRALRRYRENHRCQVRWSESDALLIMRCTLNRIRTAYGVDAPHELEIFALNSLVRHPLFDCHRLVKDCLADPQNLSPDSSYAERLNGLAPSAWCVIEDECQQLDVKEYIINKEPQA